MNKTSTNRSLLAALAVVGVLSAVAAGCGPSAPQVIVQGQTLIIAEQNYNASNEHESYCQPLTTLGQFEVMLTDVPVCNDMQKKKMNQQIFHSQEIRVLRMIFRGAGTQAPLLVTQNNVLTVGRTDCNKSSGASPDAVAFFSHNPTGSKTFDVNVMADAGKITIAGNGYDKAAQTLAGKYDLTFGAERVTGDFTASLCAALTYTQRYGE